MTRRKKKRNDTDALLSGPARLVTGEAAAAPMRQEMALPGTLEVKIAPYPPTNRLPADTVPYGEPWGGPWKKLVGIRYIHYTNGETWGEVRWVPA